MKESTWQKGHLVGIITEPAVSKRRACLMVSAGLMPKFGPFRLYTQLARRLARDGYTTLRLDLGGIGDSGPSISASPARERTHAEIAAAVEHLTRSFAIDSIVMGGLCSGAEDSFRYAETDPRVSGVWLIDPFAYKTPGWHARHLAYRAMRRSLRALGVYAPLPIDTANRLVDYQYMPHDESSRILRALVDRHARAHFVYTGGAHDHFNHAGQLAAMYPDIPLGDRVTVDYFSFTDHTQVFGEDRDRVIDAIGDRLASW